MAVKPQKTAHRFGGVWTEIKLKALTDYLRFYQTALKNQGFDTWYIDAFAGTGDRTDGGIRGGLMENEPLCFREEILDGSARKAVAIDPPFTHYWFCEAHQGRARSLERVRAEHPGLDISVRPGEANQELKRLFASEPWSSGRRRHLQRGVVLLDPYGMSVDWSTLKMLADTRRVDVWYLFPLKAVNQQLAGNLDSVDIHKRRKLEQIFGTSDWENELYESNKQPSLFSNMEEKRKSHSKEEISKYARERLRGIFEYVSEPLPLLINNGTFFEFYCLSNNVNAIPLIRKGVDSVIKKYKPASHRKFVL